MGWIMSLISIVLGWLGRKDERDQERAAGEKTGQLETENAALKDFVKTERDVEDARAGVSNDPDSVRSDPDNLGPAQ